MQERKRDFSILKDRIVEFLEAKGLTKASFYKETGAPNGILSQNNGISEENLLRFIETYPDVNLRWLFFGEGKMILDQTPETDSAKPGRVYPLHAGPVAYPVVEDLYDGNVADIVVEPDEWPGGDAVRVQSVPLYEWDASSGLSDVLCGAGGSTNIGPLVLPNLPPCDGALYVRGGAMLPLLKSGDIVVYKKVRPEAANIEWNKMYLLSYRADGGECSVVRYLHRADDGAHVQLLDPDPHRPIRIVALSEICALALVKATVRFNAMG